MNEHRIGIIMNGVTGRMGTNQHLFHGIYWKGPKVCSWPRKPPNHGKKMLD
jgi:hypothetical protein